MSGNVIYEICTMTALVLALVALGRYWHETVKDTGEGSARAAS